MNGASFGNFGQTGRVAVISFDEALLVLSKWADERSRMRLDVALEVCSASLEGYVEAVRGDMVDFRLDSLGFISIHLPLGTLFEYADPEAMRLTVPDRAGEDPTGEPVVFGAAIRAERKTGEVFLFVELIRSR